MLKGKFVGDSGSVMSTEETDSIVHSLQYAFPTQCRNILLAHCMCTVFSYTIACKVTFLIELPQLLKIHL